MAVAANVFIKGRATKSFRVLRLAAKMSDMDDPLLFLVCALAMAIGLLGTFLPLVPGLTLVWAAALVYGVVHGFGDFGVVAFSIITVLALLGLAAGFVFPSKRAGSAGASRLSIAIGVAAGLVGFFVVPIVGLPLGAALGIYFAEIARQGSSEQAWESTRATLVGMGWALVAQFILGILMVLSWLSWVVVA